MTDYGIYVIKKDEETGEFIVIEQLEGRTTTHDTLEEVGEYIKEDILKVDAW